MGNVEFTDQGIPKVEYPESIGKNGEEYCNMLLSLIWKIDEIKGAECFYIRAEYLEDENKILIWVEFHNVNPSKTKYLNSMITSVIRTYNAKFHDVVPRFTEKDKEPYAFCLDIHTDSIASNLEQSQIRDEIRELKEMIEDFKVHVEYMPGSSKYEEAKSRYESSHK